MPEPPGAEPPGAEPPGAEPVALAPQRIQLVWVFAFFFLLVFSLSPVMAV